MHDVQALVKRFKTDLHNAAGYVQEPKKLKEHVKELYGKYVSDDTVSIVVLDLVVVVVVAVSLFAIPFSNKKISTI